MAVLAEPHWEAVPPPLPDLLKGLGHVTHTLHALEAGDPVGVRGPLGNWFPMDEIEGRNVVVLGPGTIPKTPSGKLRRSTSVSLVT